MTRIRVHILFAVSILCSLLAFTANSQDTLTTRSGQIVVVGSDGEYKVVTPVLLPKVKAINDENGSTDASVFEIPTQKSIAMTPSQKALHSYLTSVLQQEEVNLLMQVQKKQKTIAAAKAKDAPGNDKYVSALGTDLKQTTKTYKQVSDRLQKLQRMNLSPDKNLDQNLNKIKEYTELNVSPVPVQQVASQYTPPASAEGDAAADSVAYPTTFQLEEKKRGSEDYCTIAYQGKDEATGKNKKEVAAANFFNFTQPKLKPYFKADDFLSADAFVTKLGKEYFLTVEIKLKSKDASKSYGSIDLNSELRLQYIDGEQSLLYSIVQDYGEIEPYSGHTLYKAVYPLTNDNIAYMNKKLLDTVGIMWSSGFEQYDIYQVDFLKMQMNCLKNGKYSKK